MEVYILDNLLRRIEVVDVFDSLIWTERWHELGDFELDLHSTFRNRSFFTIGTRLAINRSFRVMVVETVEDTTSSDGEEILKVKGRSLEALLEDRAVKQSLSNLETEPDWTIVDTPANVARIMFNHICRSPGGLDTKDEIPFLMPGTIFPEDTIPEGTTPIEWVQAPDLLYRAIKNVCELYDLGFRLVRNFDTSQLYFDIYSGNDRTRRQTLLKPVIFSVGLDTIENTTEFASVQGSKNVAYVFSESGWAIVYGENVDEDVEGFERRVIVVNASIDPNHPNVSTALQQAGTEALLEHRATELFDGEVNQYNEYRYGLDYELGDLVELANKDGVVTYKRVSEQIFVDDANGERSYPTLTMDMFAGVNTWLSYDNNPIVWQDFTIEFWADM